MKAGKVTISSSVILSWLQLDGGCIRNLEFNHELQTIDFLIEHSEMPEVSVNQYAPPVMLKFTKYQDNVGNSVAIREPIKGD